MSSSHHPSNPIFFELTQQSLSLQSQFESRLGLRERTLENKIDHLLLSLNSRIGSIRAYHKSLLIYEKELKNLCFSTIDDFETKIKDLDAMINSETNNLLSNLTQNFAITISNAYCSLLQELKDTFSSKTSLSNFDFGNFRPHFSAMFQAFDIDIPKEFSESAGILEQSVTASFKQCLDNLCKDQKPQDFMKNPIVNQSGSSNKRQDETEEDDIDKRMKSLDKKMEADSQSTKTRNKDPSDVQSSSKSKSQTGEASGGFFSKMKSIFSKKKTNDLDDAGTVATEMKLGDEAKFRYDPIKKKYIFEGEEELPEEVIPPPLMSGTSSRSAVVEKDKNDAVGTAQIDYLKPPSRSHIHKKKAEPKKNVEKFSVFNPNEKINKENIGQTEKTTNEAENEANVVNPSFQQTSFPSLSNNPNSKILKKRRYSEGISLHFEKIVRNMKDKLNSFLNSRQLKNEAFYADLALFQKQQLDPFKLLEEHIRPCFNQKIEEFRNFRQEVDRRDEENKEGFRNFHGKNEQSDEKIAELALKLSKQSRENLKLEGSIIHLQNKCFGILNDNLWILMNSRKEGPTTIENSTEEFKGLSVKYEEITKFSKKNQEELLAFAEQNITENRSFFIGIIEKLLQKIIIVFNEKKTLYEGFSGLMKLKTHLESQISELGNEMNTKKVFFIRIFKKFCLGI